MNVLTIIAKDLNGEVIYEIICHAIANIKDWVYIKKRQKEWRDKISGKK